MTSVRSSSLFKVISDSYKRVVMSTYRYSASVSPALSWNVCPSPIMLQRPHRPVPASNCKDASASASAWLMKKYGSQCRVQPDRVDNVPVDQKRDTLCPTPNDLRATSSNTSSHIIDLTRPKSAPTGRVLHQCSTCKVLYSVCHFCPLRNDQRIGLITDRPPVSDYRPKSANLTYKKSKRKHGTRPKTTPGTSRTKRRSAIDRSQVYHPGECS